jgi:hypothetical protein
MFRNSGGRLAIYSLFLGLFSAIYSGALADGSHGAGNTACDLHNPNTTAESCRLVIKYDEMTIESLDNPPGVHNDSEADKALKVAVEKRLLDYYSVLRELETR